MPFNWQKLIEERGHSDPSDLDAQKVRKVVDDFWQVEKNVFASAYADSTAGKLLATDYYWAHDASMLLCMVGIEEIDDEQVSSLLSKPAPDVWPFLLADIKNLEIIQSKLHERNRGLTEIADYLGNWNPKVFTLDFYRLSLFYCGPIEGVAPLIGFRVHVHTTLCG